MENLLRRRFIDHLEVLRVRLAGGFCSSIMDPVQDRYLSIDFVYLGAWQLKIELADLEFVRMECACFVKVWNRPIIFFFKCASTSTVWKRVLLWLNYNHIPLAWEDELR